MKYLLRKTLIAVCITMCLTWSKISAQTDDEPLGDVKYDHQSKILGIYWSDKEPDFTCFKSYANLKLVKILYDNDKDAYQLGNLIFANQKGIREEFGFSLNPIRDYSTVDASHLRVFIGEGKSYRVGAFRCGAGGNSDPQIFSIERIPLNKIVKKTKKN